MVRSKSTGALDPHLVDSQGSVVKNGAGHAGQTPYVPVQGTSTAEAPSFAVLKSHPDADPVRQLLYATFHARRQLDRIDRAIKKQLKKQGKHAPDPLFFTPVGQQLAQAAHATRGQLAALAKQYIALGIEERQTKVMEDWAAVLLPFVTALMDDPDLALTRKQRDRLPDVVERHVRMLERPELS